MGIKRNDAVWRIWKQSQKGRVQMDHALAVV